VTAVDVAVPPASKPVTASKSPLAAAMKSGFTRALAVHYKKSNKVLNIVSISYFHVDTERYSPTEVKTAFVAS
jgi:hypothetical protein